MVNENDKCRCLSGCVNEGSDGHWCYVTGGLGCVAATPSNVYPDEAWISCRQSVPLATPSPLLSSPPPVDDRPLRDLGPPPFPLSPTPTSPHPTPPVPHPHMYPPTPPLPTPSSPLHELTTSRPSPPIPQVSQPLPSPPHSDPQGGPNDGESIPFGAGLSLSPPSPSPPRRTLPSNAIK